MLVTSALILSFLISQIHPRSRETATIAETCQCATLTCVCCGTIPAIINNACLEATYDPNNFELNLNFLANGESVYTTKINSGNFPICAPVFPPACWAFNRIHIDKDNAQVKSVLKLGLDQCPF